MSNLQNNIADPASSVDTDVDLDAFADEFFGQSSTPPESTEQASSPEKEEGSDPNTEEDEESDASQSETEDTQETDEEDALAPGDDSDEEQEEKDDNPGPPKKQSRLDKRIGELLGREREAQERAEALEARLNEVLAKLEGNKQEEQPKPGATHQATTDEVGKPSPEDMNEDGTPKYPLGDFDSNYIRDLTRFTLESEAKAMKAQQEAERAKQQEELALSELNESWNEGLVSAQERYPDYQEKGAELISSFSDIDQNYAQYLTTTLMSMDHGHDVFYYLASNPDEAKRIIASGPNRATLALGRIEAKFADAEAEKQLARPKVSKAPTPPAHLNKGTSVAKPALRGDEDDVDLDDFAKALFKRR